jgi:hypothetical protein
MSPALRHFSGLTLFVPGLLLPEEILAATTFDLTAPALSLILGRGRRVEITAEMPAALFGLKRLPVAALRKVGAGKAAEGDWLCLDPVHWRIGARGATLDDPKHLALTDDENAALLEAVAPLFADWGALSSSQPGHWELRLARPLALETQPLPHALHQPIDPELPAGADGQAWRRLIFEAQLLLAAHPVNRQREETGLPTINSLWPWGQGALPATVAKPFGRTLGADASLMGLCRLAGIDCQPAPPCFTPELEDALVVIEALATAALGYDALAWREELMKLDRDWLAPALSAGSEITLIGQRLGSAPIAVAFHWKRGDRLRFWRKPRPLTELK